MIGGKLGKVVEVDVDVAGIELSDYLRVRIDWPLGQRLLARFRTSVKGQSTPHVYPMMYERVPHFCFHCGLIGHNEEQCEYFSSGKPSMNYDATLRCYRGESLVKGESLVDIEGAIPAAVDAHDGFDVQEKGSEARVEEDLVNTVNNWQLCPNKGGRGTDAMPGAPNFVEGGASGGAVLEVAPLAMKFMEDTARVLVGEWQAPLVRIRVT
jgi:hypothetical protein